MFWLTTLILFLSSALSANAEVEASFQGYGLGTFAEHLSSPTNAASEKLDINGQQKFKFNSHFSAVVGGKAWIEGVYLTNGSEYPQPLVGLGGGVPAASHPEGDDLGDLKRLAREQLEQLPLLRVRRREACLDQIHAQSIQGAEDPHLLLGGEAQASTPHAVAQGGVV